MNCQSVRDLLVDHWDQSHAAQTGRPVQEHLQQCEPCRQLSAEYSLSHQLLQELPEVEPAENFEWRLRLRLNQIDKEGFAEQQEAPSGVRRLSSMQFAGSAAAAALVVLAVGFLALRSPDTGLQNSTPALENVVQGTPSASPSAVNTASNGIIGSTSPEQLRWTADRDRPGLPNLAPTRPDFLKIVPVSAGVPLGPEAISQPAPSILGAKVPRLAPLPR